MWQRLLGFKLAKPHKTIGEFSRLRYMILDWVKMGIKLTDNIFLSFIFQNSILAGTQLRKEVDWRLEHLVQQSNPSPLSLEIVVQAVELC